MGYRVVDGHSLTLGARYGQPEGADVGHARTLDVSARVGSSQRDSTHEIRGSQGWGMNAHLGESLPLNGSQEALQTVLWAATNKEIRDSQEAWARVQADQQVRVANTDDSDDFSKEEIRVDLADPAALDIDQDAWQALLIDASTRLDAHSGIVWSRAYITARAENRYVVTSEGTSIRQARTWYRLAMQTWARAEDGTVIDLYRWTDVSDAERLPSADEVQTWADDLADFTTQVLEAGSGTPYAGPLILRGRAAGVFVHEVLGHRVEGHRQKDEGEGQTFKDKVGELLLPEDISIIDDPTLTEWAGFDLNGHYAYDEEGTKAQPAVLVENGVFKGFLMSRSPIKGFQQSNGHGRAQVWRQPVARMANTIVSTTNPVPFEKLKDQLRAEAKAQGREFGLIIDEIGGGFTMTGRVYPNAFNVRATYAYRVFVDGRPDELIRGVDLVGTPLVALSQVVAAGDDPGVFNGFCGAESGSVPNSAVSPSLLIRHLEVQKKEKGSTRPPLLPKPVPEGDA
ncbi:MAG: peptidase U62 [Rhodobacterales bacterium]|nr:peptidase U62 [Rhodobacterales bacterium]